MQRCWRRGSPISLTTTYGSCSPTIVIVLQHIVLHIVLAYSSQLQRGFSAGVAAVGIHLLADHVAVGQPEPANDLTDPKRDGVARGKGQMGACSSLWCGGGHNTHTPREVACKRQGHRQGACPSLRRGGGGAHNARTRTVTSSQDSAAFCSDSFALSSRTLVPCVIILSCY